MFDINDYLDIQVLRDGQWLEQDAAVLVPGDIISIKLGEMPSLITGLILLFEGGKERE